MKKVNIVSSIFFLSLSVAALLESRQLPFGNISTPQMGFFPLILSVVLAISSLFLLGQAIKEKKDERTNPFNLKSGRWKQIGLTVGALFTFVIFLDGLGYRICTFLLIAFLLRIIEPQKWWLVITVALLSSQFSYLIFGVLLKIPLPMGILGV